MKLLAIADARPVWSLALQKDNGTNADNA